MAVHVLLFRLFQSEYCEIEIIFEEWRKMACFTVIDKISWIRKSLRTFWTFKGSRTRVRIHVIGKLSSYVATKIANVTFEFIFFAYRLRCSAYLSFFSPWLIPIYPGFKLIPLVASFNKELIFRWTWKQIRCDSVWLFFSLDILMGSSFDNAITNETIPQSSEVTINLQNAPENRVKAYLPGSGAIHDHQGGSPRTRPFHCTSEWADPCDRHKCCWLGSVIFGSGELRSRCSLT